MLEYPIACYVLTAQGLHLAQTLAARLPLVIFAAERLRPSLPEEQLETLPASLSFFPTLAACAAENFPRFRAHLFLTAAGIAVRCIAPHLGHKSTDPAVLVMEQQGRFVIPLLAGHWGGGNALARHIAQLCGGRAVITTATDTAGLPAIDLLAQASDCRILDWPAVKDISAALLAGEAVPLCDPQHIFSEEDAPSASFPRCATPPECGPAVVADWQAHPPRAALLRLAPRRLTLGIGCRRGVSADDICAAVHAACRTANIIPEAVTQLASIDAKRDEAGLLEAAARLGLPLRWFSAAELGAVAVPHPSAKASAVFATAALGVCEGAALLAAGRDSRLLLPKQGFQARVTVACAAHFSFATPKEQS